MTTKQILLIALVALVAFAVRVHFIVAENAARMVWDASLYWSVAGAVSDGLSLDVIAAIIYGREGLFPVIVGGLMTVFPAEPQTAYMVAAVLDALLCAMLVHLAFRLDGGLAVAALAGFGFALYVPAITGTGTFSQQVFVRFALMLSIYGYTMAFTNDEGFFARGWVVVGVVGAVLLGFASVTTRPLMWLLLVVPIGLTLMMDDVLVRSAMRRALYYASGAVVVLVLLMGIFGAGGDSLLRAATGLGSGGQVDGQTTVVAFADFWAPSSWQTLEVSATDSLFGDFLRDPLTFTWRTGFSLFNNYRYPDMAFMQAYGLGFDGQKIQHTVMIVLGGLGLALLAGQVSPRREPVLLLIVAGAALSLLYSIISVEPRRVGALMPFFALGAGFALVASFNALNTVRGYVRVWEAALVVVAVVVWLPFVGGLWLAVIPAPVVAYGLLTVIRLTLAGLVAWRLVRLWAEGGEITVRALPLAFIGGLLAVVAVGMMQDTTWRGWSTRTASPITQTVTAITPPDGLFPWLVVDVEPPQNVEISINGVTVKAAGEPLRAWLAGLPPLWSPYETLAEISNTTPTRRQFYALPIPPDLLAAGRAEIVIRPAERVTVRGDLVDGSDYVGASLSPWYDGDSFWRWQWNANDPRIPQRQTRNGDYGAGHRQPRIFVVYAPIGAETNAFGAAQSPEATTICGSDDLLIAPSAPVYACRDATRGVVRFFHDGDLVGEVDSAVLLRREARDTLLAQVEVAGGGRVAVFQVLNTLFVANIYDADDAFVYSLVFPR